jgi:CRP/FNR family transcriptional regulator, cyclic AMP receptor protein
MRKVLYILGQLHETDIDWFLEIGTKQTLAQDEVIIREGHVTNGLYIILSGTLAVIGSNQQVVARLERGELVGEMSLIEVRAPTVSVKALISSEVFLLPRAVVQRRLDTHEGFAARFYKAIALIMSDRLRSTTTQLSPSNSRTATAEVDELDDNVLDQVYLAGTRFEALLKRLSEARRT